MPNCPKCRQAVQSDTVTCPYCRTSLKAFGHPGIPLYQATGDTSLCQTCAYDADNSCNYPQRPNARDCTMYQKNGTTQSPIVGGSTGPKNQTMTRGTLFSRFAWWRQHPAWLWLSGLFVVIFLVKLAAALK